VRARLVVVGAAAVVAAASIVQAAGPVSIAGTYRLVKRTLPDGKELAPPAVVGFQNFVKGYRNFSVKWTQPDGTPVSITLVAKYQLSATKYCEQPVLWVQNNLGTPGVKYDAPPEKAQCSDVKIEGGKITFKVMGEPVVATFDGSGLTATAEGLFTDVWERIK